MVRIVAVIDLTVISFIGIWRKIESEGKWTVEKNGKNGISFLEENGPVPGYNS